MSPCNQYIDLLDGKPEVKRAHGRTRKPRIMPIKMAFKQAIHRNNAWIYVYFKRMQWMVLLNSVVNFRAGTRCIISQPADQFKTGYRFIQYFIDT